MFFNFAIVALLSLSFSAQAWTERRSILSLVDQSGRSWSRRVVQEKTRDGRTLLLVVDHPKFRGELPQMIYRHSFSSQQQAQLRMAVAQVRSYKHNSTYRLITSTNPIWPITHQWTDQDEVDYGKWLQQNANPDFLVGGGVAVDCADYAITLRWIYAHDHGLPAADQLGNGFLFGSWLSTTDWDQLPTDSDWHKDQRFKAALSYVLGVTYTHTLYTDLYPVKINPTYVAPGTIFLTLTEDSGHTRTIYDIGTSSLCSTTEACIQIIWGNEPASENGWTTEFVPFYLGLGGGGFLRFRWPERSASGDWQLRPSAQMRGYSMEQFTWNTVNYLLNVSKQMNLWTTPVDRYEITADSVIAAVNDRVTTTERGYFLCNLVPCKAGDDNYVTWSTPVRDQALVNGIQTFQVVAAQVNANDPTVMSVNQNANTSVLNGAPFSYLDILTQTLAKSFSSNPTADFNARWNISNVDMESELHVNLQVLIDNWSWREDLVAQAQALCFAAGAKCSATDPKVVALDTSRLDKAFRIAQTQFVTLINSAPQQTQQNIEAAMEYVTGEALCGTTGDQPCTMYDWILGSPQHLQKMSSDPLAQEKQRYGY